KPGPNFAIFARTDALVAGSSTQEALERLSSYEHVGIDGVLIQSIDRDPSQLLNLVQIISERTKMGVVGTIPTAYPQITAEQWKRYGASLIVYSNQLLRASIPSIEKAASALADDMADRLEPQIASVSSLLELMNH
ncbi:MAG TPA: isocitrate lyase/phosphoenolpyruvate mutase family protein, partial [Pyrinomonadaceae bacterium]|nr:isocitrate lyase/phosphoenolpyruvate mutase family protein [Pyrinomonadaceae bacterium]